MFKLPSLFRRAPSAPPPSVPDGARVYAVGDIHGRLDLLEALARAIEADDEARGSADTTVILLGDLVDRGPDSAGVLAFARNWAARRRVRVLMGNHEEMFLDSFEKTEVLSHFLRFGGKETLLSYPIDSAAYAVADISETQALMRGAVPAADLAYIRSFEDMIEIGDYLFVHAGIMPGLPLDAQKTADLRWIRQPFLDTALPFGPVVVHGHTIYDRAEVRSNRIGIDTGAYRSGRLTALGLEGTDRWLLEARETDGGIETAQRRLS